MWAVVSIVSVPPGHGVTELRAALEETAVPALRSIDGFLGATWTLSDDRSTGIGFYRFATERGARTRAGSIEVGGAAPGGATVIDVHLLEVVLDIDA